MKVPASSITRVIETDALGIPLGTFRGCLDDKWLPAFPDPMSWQRSGAFAAALKAKGIRSITMGDLTEEWFLYSIAHPIQSPSDIIPNLERYYSEDLTKAMVKMYRSLPDDAGPAQSQKLYGEILSDLQVHLPVRILARDLHAAGFPVLRYQIRWTPEQVRSEGEAVKPPC